MTYLTRLTKLGMARRDDGTYLAPTVSVPWDTGTRYEDVIQPLRDESVRANDVVLQGLTAGALEASWDIQTNFYPDFAGHFFTAMGLFDTVSGGVTTTLSAGTAAGATSITTAASIPSGSTIMIDTGGKLEYAVTGAPSGPGPYTIPITSPSGGLLFAHLSSAAVIAQYTHTFAQNRSFTTTWPKYCFTTDNGAEQRGWPGCVASEMQIKIDPKGLVKFATKYLGLASAAQSTFSYAASQAQAVMGWGWTVTNGGGSSTRGISFDMTWKRAVEAIHSSTGSQSPREIFPGALEIDGAYKAIFEDSTDINLFRSYTQMPTVHTLTQPASFGGCTLAITMSQSGYITGVADNGQMYQQLDMSMAGMANTTDGGISKVVLKNFQAASY